MDYSCSNTELPSSTTESATSVRASAPQRVGALLLRIRHHLLAPWAHKAWLYVDDLLTALVRSHALQQLSIMVIFFAAILAPISWKKGQIGDSLLWCGWQ